MSGAFNVDCIGPALEDEKRPLYSLTRDNRRWFERKTGNINFTMYIAEKPYNLGSISITETRTDKSIMVNVSVPDDKPYDHIIKSQIFDDEYEIFYHKNIYYIHTDTYDGLAEAYMWLAQKLNTELDDYTISGPALDRLKKTATNLQDQELNHTRRQVQNRRDETEEARRRLARTLQDLHRLEAQLRTAEEAAKNQTPLFDRLKADWQALNDDPNIEKVEYGRHNDRFTITTETLPIHAEPSGSIYEGGPYKIHINLYEAAVNVKAVNTYESYWGEGCPHPHIEPSGKICLGNAEESLAELFSEYQLAPIVYLILDFLQSANQEDAAGEKVQNWPLVEEGPDHEQYLKTYATCEDCDADVDEDDLHTVYGEADYEDGDLSDERLVCPDCRGNNYSYSESFGEAISDDYYSEDLEEEYR